jgi:hypothetical protein
MKSMRHGSAQLEGDQGSLQTNNRGQKWLLGILTAILVFLGVCAFIPAGRGADHSRTAVTKFDISILKTAVTAYHTEYDSYPPHDPVKLARVLQGDSFDGFNPKKIVFWESRQPESTWMHSTAGSLNAQGQFTDAWGEPYVFEFDPATGRLEAWSRWINQKSNKAAAIEGEYYEVLIPGKDAHAN